MEQVCIHGTTWLPLHKFSENLIFDNSFYSNDEYFNAKEDIYF